MKCRRFRPSRRLLIALSVVLLSPVGWLAFLAVVPTNCARLKIADRLSAASGRRVTLGKVCLGALGGVALSDLKIGAPGSEADPWLQVDTASINVSLFQLLLGHIEPTAIDVRGLRLRALRRLDGSLELADLLRPEQDAAAVAGSEPSSTRNATAIEVKVRDASVLIVDEPTGTRLAITGAEGRGTCQGRLASITELSGTLNGGHVQLAAQLDRSEPLPRFEGQVRLRDVALGEGMNALAYLVPVLSGTGGDLDGKLTLDLYLRGQGDTLAALRETVIGQGRLGLDPVALDGSKLLNGLADLFDLPEQGRVGDVWADLTIKDGRIASENLTIDIVKVPVVLTGWTDFEGRINYRFRAEGFIEKLPGKAQDYLNQLKPALKLNELAGVSIQGTVDRLSVTSQGVPITRAEGSRRIHEVGRQVRDQLRR